MKNKNVPTLEFHQFTLRYRQPMGQCGSQLSSKDADALLRDIANIRSLLKEQREQAEEAIARLTLRIEHLEKYSSDLLISTNEQRDARAKEILASSTKVSTQPSAKSLSESVVEITIAQGLAYELKIDMDSKVPINV